MNVSAPHLPARTPIRLRVTAAFGAVMALLFVVIGLFIYHAMAGALLDEIDAGLRFRAEATLAAARAGTAATPTIPELQEPGEAFAQVVTRNGVVRTSTEGFTTPLLTSSRLAGVSRPSFVQYRVEHVAGTARLLALPLSRAPDSDVLVVGTTMNDRADALHTLRESLLIGGPSAIALACLAGWFIAGLALRPVEDLRREAAAITSSGLDRRLPVPPARDQLRRLAETLNAMLGRLEESFRHEKEFIERASHELRTPLTALRAEVDLALSTRRTDAELVAALASVSEETDRLARLAEDLLALARVSNGRLPLRVESISLPDTLHSAVELFSARAEAKGVSLAATAPAGTIIADPLRLRQVLVNLLDNALRHTPHGGAVSLVGAITDSGVRITVSDTGPGFDDDQLQAISESWCKPGAGLGLRLVRAITASHGGAVSIGRAAEGGARVEISGL